MVKIMDLPDNIKLPSEPFNTWVLDVDDTIKKEGCQEVTSHSMYVASSTDFHPEGLFSENIFGQIGTPERLMRFGYINLHSKIYQPQIYRTICQLKQMYSSIMEGKVFAKFNEEYLDFEKCDKEDPDADTGYSFFIKNFERVRLAETNSQKRLDMITFLKKNHDQWYCTKYLVEPAGLRDIRGSESRLETEDINKLYIALLSFSKRIPNNTTNPIYDGIKMNILKKCLEIFTYIENIFTGKRGFFRGSYTRRRIAFGTRNVISSGQLNLRTPNDPRGLQYDETYCPLLQTMKGLQPCIIYQLRLMALSAVFPSGASQIALIDPKTYELKFVEVSPTEIDKFKSDDGIANLINKFQDIHVRHDPITVEGTDKKQYYMYMVHDYNNEIGLFRNLKDFKDVYPGEVHDEAIRPLTWAELLYLATSRAADGKHEFITRYPIGQGSDSTYPTKIKLISTVPNRMVRIIVPSNREQYKEFLHYPILNAPFVDSLCPFPGRLQSLSGDFDGDMVSGNTVMAKDANAQVESYLNSLESIITPDKQLYTGGNTTLCQTAIYNLSRDAYHELSA